MTRLRRLVALLFTSTVFVATAATPASAAIVDTDRVLLTANGFDFGINWTLSGPRNGGYLDWDDDGATINPRLRGWLYINNEEDECAWVQVQHFTAAGQSLALAESDEYCAQTNSREQFWATVDDYDHPNIAYVTVRLIHRVSSNTAEILDTETEWLNP